MFFCVFEQPVINAYVALFSLDGRWDISPANFRKTHVGRSSDTASSPRLPYSLQPIRSHRFTLANAVEGTRCGKVAVIERMFTLSDQHSTKSQDNQKTSKRAVLREKYICSPMK
jgi:hypothetical protein